MLQLSPSTVSRALSDHQDISTKTKRRVKEAAAKFNYAANLHASFFRNKRSNLIALILPEMNMFYIPSMINAINEFLFSTHYSLFVFISKDKLVREKRIVEQCIEWAVEGVLISPSSETRNLKHLAGLKLAGIKTVVLDKVLKNTKFPSVAIDNVNAAYSAVDELIQNGHKNVLGIFGNPNIAITEQRIKGYQQAHKNSKLEYKTENVITIVNSDELDSILPVVLNHNKSITAIFSMSDEILAKVHFHLMKIGKRVPEDISVISISDGFYPHLTFPKTSFVRDSGSRMGKMACELLIENIKKENPASQHLELETNLVHLNSVGEISV